MKKQQLQQEYTKVSESLSSGTLRGDELISASRRLKELRERLERLAAQEKREARRQEAEKVLKTETDPELQALAEEELRSIADEESAEEHGAAAAAEKQTAIVEIRPGTGGEEAALFAADLARMYLRFAERRGFTVTLIDETTSDLGGFKSLTFSIKGPGAYALLKNEAGVHRVQRIPDTEKTGRIHTSTATVAVLPKVEAKEFSVPAQELRVDTMRASGPGGQFVNRRESAVRVLHIPTGIIVTSQAARTQNANREQATEILLAKLAELQREKEASTTGAARKAQIGTGERAEKIRTYNYPQDRVTDHRIGKSWRNLPTILDGDLEKIISAIQEKP